jgi:hypothetical protein
MNAISNNAHRPVDVDPQLAAIALDRLDPLRPFRDGLTALGHDHRVAIRPIPTKRTPGRAGIRFRPGRATVGTLGGANGSVVVHIR